MFNSIDAPWEEEIIFLTEPMIRMDSIEAYFHGTKKKYYYCSKKLEGNIFGGYFCKKIITGELFTTEDGPILRYYNYKNGKYHSSKFPSFPAIILKFNETYYFYWFEDNWYDDNQTCKVHTFFYINGQKSGDWSKYTEDDAERISEIIDEFKERAKCVK